MDEALKERLAAVRLALGVVDGLLVDAETSAPPGSTRDGLLLARARSLRIQAWIRDEEVKCVR